MFVVVTKVVRGKRVHVVVDEETDQVIGEYFVDANRAKKACSALNKELKKREKQYAKQ